MPYGYSERTLIGDREIVEEQQYQILWKKTNHDKVYCTNLAKWEEWLIFNGHRKEGDINPLTGQKYIVAICPRCDTELRYCRLIPKDQQGLPLCLECGQKEIKLAKDRRSRR